MQNEYDALLREAGNAAPAAAGDPGSIWAVIALVAAIVMLAGLAVLILKRPLQIPWQLRAWGSGVLLWLLFAWGLSIVQDWKREYEGDQLLVLFLGPPIFALIAWLSVQSLSRARWREQIGRRQQNRP